VAGDWLGEVRLSEAADGKLVAQLPPNPPTLDMLVQAQKAAAAAASALAQTAAAELATAKAQADEKAKAHTAAAAAAAAAEDALQKLLAEKAVLDQAQSAQASASK
jgi:hypothetical protein